MAAVTRRASVEIEDGDSVADDASLGQVDVAAGHGGVDIGQAAHDVDGEVELGGSCLACPGQRAGDLERRELRDRRGIGDRDQFGQQHRLLLGHNTVGVKKLVKKNGIRCRIQHPRD